MIAKTAAKRSKLYTLSVSKLLIGLDEFLWGYSLELAGIERGCSETCKQERRAERRLHKEQMAIAAEKKRIENAILFEQETIDRLLARVTNSLHNPSTARFDNLLRNNENNSVCGTVIAISGSGKEVREIFAVKNYGELTMGYVYVGSGAGARSINVGHHAASRLCPSEMSHSITHK